VLDGSEPVPSSIPASAAARRVASRRATTMRVSILAVGESPPRSCGVGGPGGTGPRETGKVQLLVTAITGIFADDPTRALKEIAKGKLLSPSRQRPQTGPDFEEQELAGDAES
jgi:hypothetical protein